MIISILYFLAAAILILCLFTTMFWLPDRELMLWLEMFKIVLKGIVFSISACIVIFVGGYLIFKLIDLGINALP